MRLSRAKAYRQSVGDVVQLVDSLLQFDLPTVGNGRLDPGEESDVYLAVENRGNAAATAAAGT